MSLDVCAMVHGRMVELRSTLSSVGIVGGCTVYIHHRLRGRSREDVLGQWTCSQCFAPRCWPVSKRCYWCGAAKEELPTSSKGSEKGKGKGKGKSDRKFGPLGRKCRPRLVNRRL